MSPLRRGRTSLRTALVRLRRRAVAVWLRWRTPPTLSQQGERSAERWLRAKGWRIVARGLRSRTGELDLVALDGPTLVFVEVKTRRSHDAGHPAEAVDQEKQRRITREALWFLRTHGLLEREARFDVLAVTWSEGAETPRIEHYLSAFEPPGRGQMFA